MRTRSIPWYKLAAIVLVLALLMPALVACDDDDEVESAASMATTPAETTPGATTLAPTISQEPIKIGVLCSWSGPAGIAGLLVDGVLKVVDKELEKKGGINVGGVIRPVKWIKYDDKTQVADNTSGYKKLVLEDKVSAVIYGGATASALTASSDSAEELKVPLFSVGSTPADLSNRPYTIRCVYPNMSSATNMVMDFAVNDLKPKTMGFLMGDMQEIRTRGSQMKGIANAAGIKVVYEEYVTSGTIDFSSFLTRIRMEKPDVLIADSGGTESFYVNVFKQMPELGGWGDIKVVGSSVSSSGTALKEKGAEGSYHWVVWGPGLPYAGSQEFEQSFPETAGRDPSTNDAVLYYAPEMALKAIELARSDKPEDIAKAARSGNLMWNDAPGGPFKINPDGTHTNAGHMMQFKDGKLTPVGK
ncbi:MAG: ABC transporter substrate-binding protein [Dehalococcoidia bacterium]|nr:ABC transporter substrate-binding protein [Dehalococcoidia bacterium]